MTIVLKIGGSIFNKSASLINDLKNLDEPFILVHGGAAESTKLAEELGIETKTITSPSGFTSRYTTKEQIEVFEMVVAGKINKTLVIELQKNGINAIGLSGIDGKLLLAEKKVTRSQENGKIKIIKDDYTGKIEKVNKKLLEMLIENEFVPVIAPLALSKQNEPLNTDGDRAASIIAQSINSKKLVLFTDVDGYFRNFPNDFAEELSREELDECITKATSGMKRKLIAAKEALENGVKEVIIANGTAEIPISNALNGKRTVIRGE